MLAVFSAGLTPIFWTGAAIVVFCMGWIGFEYRSSSLQREAQMGKKFTLFKLAPGATVNTAIAKDIDVKNFEEVQGLDAGSNAEIGTASFERFRSDGKCLSEESDEKPNGGGA